LTILNSLKVRCFGTEVSLPNFFEGRNILAFKFCSRFPSSFFFYIWPNIQFSFIFSAPASLSSLPVAGETSVNNTSSPLAAAGEALCGFLGEGVGMSGGGESGMGTGAGGGRVAGFDFFSRRRVAEALNSRARDESSGDHSEGEGEDEGGG
jgi:hypothetical protein